MNRQAGSHTRVFSITLALLVLAGGVLSAVPGRIGRASAESEQAQEIGEPVEVEEETTQERIVWANPDGTYTAEIASGPVRVADPASPSGWSDIDVSLEVGPEGLQPKGRRGRHRLLRRGIRRARQHHGERPKLRDRLGCEPARPHG